MDHTVKCSQEVSNHQCMPAEWEWEWAWAWELHTICKCNSRIKGTRETENAQRQCAILCKNSKKIKPGPRKLTRELPEKLVSQSLKSTNGAGTKKTRNKRKMPMKKKT